MRLQICYLRRELKQASKQIKPSPMRHSNDDICDPTVGTHLEQLVEEAHHALCPLTTITLHCGKLGGQEVVKLLLNTGQLQY